MLVYNIESNFDQLIFIDFWLTYDYLFLIQAQEDEDDQDENDSDEDEEDEVEDDMGASDAEILDIVDDVDAQDEQTDGKIIYQGYCLDNVSRQLLSCFLSLAHHKKTLLLCSKLSE